jgi:hypothetical protein
MTKTIKCASIAHIYGEIIAHLFIEKHLVFANTI